ncbi:hypothetical protein QOZ98_002661 [Planomicrobium stackebrandtii]|uniref:DUF1835 domain-containing protein n=1 Tax=Planomicrobium stackebrandtii TaxID=253160 RepID=A0ABU0GXN0_9BACL|nr:DUF1835 domain-containing protein [Planomicrobium stackebrandtii]MDQ0429833.1 hypothetical protein [Planomicrobium stackebrandtii]
MEKEREILIETRVNYPFIYFLIEEHLVIVYRIETGKYVTGSDLIESSNPETYNVESAEDFKSFIHTERKPVEGRSIFINHRDLNKLADEINKQIRKNRQRKKGENHASSVHIVTSEFAESSLRAGLERPKTVIAFPDIFSIGPLWKMPEKEGLDFRSEWLFDNINSGQEDNEYERKFKNAVLQIEDIAPDIPVYIWYGGNAKEQIGLRFYLYLLRNKTNRIILMNTMELYEKYMAVEDGSVYFHTGFLNAEKLKLFFKNEQNAEPLPKEKRDYYLKEWAALSETEEVLRIWKDEELKTVPADYYDLLIIEKLEKLHQKQESKDFILTGKVIGEIVAELQEFVDSFYLEYRIRQLLYSGVIEIKGIPKSMSHYRIKLR